MYVTYYLFVNLGFEIEEVYNCIRLEIDPGIVYTKIKNNKMLPKCIVIKSLYKDEYLREKVKKELKYYGYDKDFQILKPLVNEYALI